MIHIKVPATSANMGAGFDCIGVALKLYNELWVEESENKLVIETLNSTDVPIPTDDTNLIYSTIKQFYDMRNKKLPGIKLVQKDSIPLTRGLGSSAACIVAGLFAANALLGTGLDKYEIARIAAQIEGHPDNVVPAVFGGVVTAALDNGSLKYVKINVCDDITFSVFVPGFTLATDEARAVLPESYSRRDVVYNTSRAALLVASLMSGNWDNMVIATQDSIHQPYRKAIIPNMEDLIKMSLEMNSKGAFLSGAGPTIIAIVQRSDAEKFNNSMNEYIKTLDNKWKLLQLDADCEGVQVI